jgi:N-acetylglucosamine-6-phosphate deacetylase
MPIISKLLMNDAMSSNSKVLFLNGKIFTGQRWWREASVLIDQSVIKKVSTNISEKDAEQIDLDGGLLVPGFIDLQLYGGLGKLFGEHPSVDSLKATYEYCLRGGTLHFMPTVATNSMDVMMGAIEAVRCYKEQQLPGVLGLHLEGPYINSSKRGAHIEQFIKKPTLEEVEELIEKGKGVIRMITLAPEVCDKEIVDYLMAKGVLVSTGHSNATYQQAWNAFEQGVPLATHLYNAMSPLQHRAPGLVGAILNHPKVMSSLVADGHHVDFAAISIAKKIMGERLFLITDAVTENKEGYYQHRLDGDKYIVADGTLSGSALSMLQAVKNCVNEVGISLEEALRMASLYPARAVQLDKKFGKIEARSAAELVWLNEDLEIKAVFTNGSLIRF